MMVIARAGRAKTAASESAVRNTVYILVGFSAALFLYVLAHPIFMPAEAALHLQCGLLIAKGKLPYFDFMELAAPAMMYFNAIPALVARVLPFHPIFIARLFFWLLYVTSTAAVAFILLKSKSRDQAVAPWFIIAYAGLPFFFLEQFGQAEQIFIFLFMPYLLLRWLRWSGANGFGQSPGSEVATENDVKEPAAVSLPLSRKQAIICGAVGGFAASLDPLFLLAFLGMEMFFWLDKQRKGPLVAPEFLAAMAVIAMSVGAAFWFGDPYIHFALPIMFYDYKHWDDRLIYVYKTPDRRDLVYMMVALLVFSLAFKKRCSLIAPMVALSIVGLGLWIIPGEVLTNQAFPMLYGCVLAGSVTLGLLINQVAVLVNRRFPILDNLSTIVKTVTIAGLLVACYFLIESLDGDSFIDFSQLNYFGVSTRADLGDFSEAIEIQTIPSDKVLILSDRDRPASPVLLQLNREPASYLLTGVPMRVLRRIFEREPLEVHEPFIKHKEKMYERLISDIRKNRPKMILVDYDSLGDLLKINGVTDAIGELYTPQGTVDWKAFEKLHPYKEYPGFQNPLQIYLLKGSTWIEVKQAPGTDPDLNLPPAAPAGTPGLPAQNPAPGPLAPGTQDQKPADAATPVVPPAGEQAPSPVANPIRI